DPATAPPSKAASCAAPPGRTGATATGSQPAWSWRSFARSSGSLAASPPGCRRCGRFPLSATAGAAPACRRRAPRGSGNMPQSKRSCADRASAGEFPRLALRCFLARRRCRLWRVSSLIGETEFRGLVADGLGFSIAHPQELVVGLDALVIEGLRLLHHLDHLRQLVRALDVPAVLLEKLLQRCRVEERVRLIGDRPLPHTSLKCRQVARRLRPSVNRTNDNRQRRRRLSSACRHVTLLRLCVTDYGLC